MDKDVKKLLDFFRSKECNVYEIENFFDNEVDFKTIKKIFTPDQAELLKAVVKQFIWTLDEWHNKEDEESHKDIRNKIAKLDARLRNHRHDHSRAFTGKAEY